MFSLQPGCGQSPRIPLTSVCLAMKPFRCVRMSYNQLALNYTEANVAPILAGWLITVTLPLIPRER